MQMHVSVRGPTETLLLYLLYRLAISIPKYLYIQIKCLSLVCKLRLKGTRQYKAKQANQEILALLSSGQL
jgi:hypothetical protein